MNASLGIASVVVALGATVAHAAPLLVDFNDRTQPTVTQSGWNAYVFTGANNDGNGVDATASALTATYGSYQVTVGDTNGATASPTLQDRYRTNDESEWPSGFTAKDLYRDFIIADSASAGQGLVITVGGLTPGQQYSGRIWSYDHGQVHNTTNTFLTDWSVNNVLVADDLKSDGPAPVDALDKSFTFMAVANGSGQLVIQGLRDSASTGNGVVINGLQLDAVPEPASFGLAAMGALGLVMRRRRASRTA